MSFIRSRDRQEFIDEIASYINTNTRFRFKHFHETDSGYIKRVDHDSIFITNEQFDEIDILIDDIREYEII